MKGQVISKRYYRIEFQLLSALAVGSGENESTDKDIVRDASGKPYIPATALAGIYRTFFQEKYVDAYFGKIDGEIAEDSKIIVYDALLCSQDYRISSRDCVGLDEWKTARTGAKFDFEILEPGAKFITFVEQDKYEGDLDAGDVIAEAWRQESVSIGQKGSRGLGRTGKVSVQAMEFFFEKEGDIQDWLDFQIYDQESWNKYLPKYEKEIAWKEGAKPDRRICIHLELEQRSPITVRSYTTDVGEENQPDYEQMTYLRTKDGKGFHVPVIPGTSWAGAFAHHMEHLDAGCTKGYFGEKSERKSDISFGESEIANTQEGKEACSKIVSRNAIDRFTGGAVENALYTEKLYYGGRTSLDIGLSGKPRKRFWQCLAMAIADLHMGFLSVGGETSVGHGLFAIRQMECQGEVIFQFPLNFFRMRRRLF